MTSTHQSLLAVVVDDSIKRVEEPKNCNYIPLTDGGTTLKRRDERCHQNVIRREFDRSIDGHWPLGLGVQLGSYKHTYTYVDSLLFVSPIIHTAANVRCILMSQSFDDGSIPRRRGWCAVICPERIRWPIPRLHPHTMGLRRHSSRITSLSLLGEAVPKSKPRM